MSAQSKRYPSWAGPTDLRPEVQGTRQLWAEGRSDGSDQAPGTLQDHPRNQEGVGKRKVQGPWGGWTHGGALYVNHPPLLFDNCNSPLYLYTLNPILKLKYIRCWESNPWHETNVRNQRFYSGFHSSAYLTKLSVPTHQIKGPNWPKPWYPSLSKLCLLMLCAA